MNPRPRNAEEYDGAFYREIGDFVRGRYLDWEFTRGTVHEVDFLVEELKLPAGARILDVGCGVGRHSLELARRGYRATGIDVSGGMIDVARQAAGNEKLSVEFVLMDAREMDFRDEFDAAICLCEGAFGLLGSQAKHLDVLRRVATSLIAGGRFILTAVHALSASQNAHPARFNCYTCTGTESVTIRNEADDERHVQIWTTAFTYPQLALMFEMAGFEIQAGYGCEAGRFGRKRLDLADVEIMMIGRKV